MAASPAEAQDVRFDIPAGRLSDALNALASQAGITVGATDPAISSIRVKAVHGKMAARAALDRVLSGTGYTFSFVTPRAVRIIRVPAKPVSRVKPPAAVQPARPVAAAEPADILVTASKQGVALERFGGTVTLVDVTPDNVGRFGARGSDAIIDRVATLSSTNLGPGRNKVFIRGVADSSFNGPSQAIVGQYLGDVRLTFDAPDPDLQLYDVRRVEVLEGPQGTLYGSGALGGIVRIVPNQPDMAKLSASFTGGVLATQHGGVGRDISGIVNLPVAADSLALRVVGYGIRDAGYIDDTLRGLQDINTVGTHGGRISLAWSPGDGWHISAGAAAQFIAGADGQYALRSQPPLARASALPQPFDNDYRLGQFTVAKDWGGLELVSATGIVRHDLDSNFDATSNPGSSVPTLFSESVKINLISNETRLSHPNPDGTSWLVGWSVLHDENEITRLLGRPDALVPIAGIRNEVGEAALFGQYSRAIGDNLTATVGGRITYSRSVGELLDTVDEADEPHRTDFHFSPTIAAAWSARSGLTFYGRFQRGFRTGGLAVSASGSTTAAQRFESDALSSFEAGMRLGRAGRDPISLNMALSYTRWGDMQADLIDATGLPYTTNLGDGRIYGLELDGQWRIARDFTIEASAFVNSSVLASPAAAFAFAKERDLPNVAKAGGRIAAHYKTVVGSDAVFSVDGALRYVGASQLGIGAPIDISQGDYFEGQLGVRLAFGDFGLLLDVDNITDTKGNRFSFGNPFSVDARDQVTPVRPRTVRFGFEAAF